MLAGSAAAASLFGDQNLTTITPIASSLLNSAVGAAALASLASSYSGLSGATNEGSSSKNLPAPTEVIDLVDSDNDDEVDSAAASAATKQAGLSIRPIPSLLPPMKKRKLDILREGGLEVTPISNGASIFSAITQHSPKASPNPMRINITAEVSPQRKSGGGGGSERKYIPTPLDCQTQGMYAKTGQIFGDPKAIGIPMSSSIPVKPAVTAPPTDLLDLTGCRSGNMIPAGLDFTPSNSRQRTQPATRVPRTAPSLQITLVHAPNQQPALPAQQQQPQQQQQPTGNSRKKPFEIVPLTATTGTPPKEPSPQISLGPSSSSSSASSSNGTAGTNPNSLLETGLLLANLQKVNPLLVASILSSSGLSKNSIPGLTQLLGQLTEQPLVAPKKNTRRRSNSQAQQQQQQSQPPPLIPTPQFAAPPLNSMSTPQHPPPSESPSLSQQIKLLQQVQLQQQQKAAAAMEQQQKAAAEQKRLQEQKQKQQQLQMLQQLQQQQQQQSTRVASQPSNSSANSSTSPASTSSGAAGAATPGFPFDPLYLSAIYANPSLYLQALSPDQLLAFYKNLPNMAGGGGTMPPTSKS